MKKPRPATRAVVTDPPGEPAVLTLYNTAGAIATLKLNPTRCLALAGDLLNLARRRPTRAAATPRKTRLLEFAELKTTPLKHWTPRHELFCQAMARGMTLSQASKFAGWSGHKGDAHHTYCRPNVRERIREIQAELASQEIKAGQTPRDGMHETAEVSLCVSRAD
jgi:hypothetical protein